MSDWIEWDGSKGGLPDTGGKKVIVRFPDGGVSGVQTVLFWGKGDLGSNWNWGQSYPDHPADIVAYRVVE